MPSRKFIYSKEHKRVIEVTDAESQPLCDELSADVATRKEKVEYGLGKGRSKRNAGAKWPMYSHSMAINMERIPEQQAMLKQHGITVDYKVTPEGVALPEIRDRAHKKAFQKAIGAYDGDAGYGDRSPENFVASNYKTPHWR